ncbi:MAG: uracil-DNA glycosylase [Planctomycetes bacterium]|nr:uracil-DNA glycosylase [Planctomycetota bacterium]
MIGPVITPRPICAQVYLIGQAPGPREGAIGRPFAWTAGRTLFRWFATIGADEEVVRSRTWIAAVCRCFPGKASSGGDRVPAPDEVAACSRWMRREITLLTPRLIIPIGRLAITQALGIDAPLAEVVGTSHRRVFLGHECDIIPLPHPSGASTWFKREPGIGLTRRALELIAAHEAWRSVTTVQAESSSSARSSPMMPSGFASRPR